MSPARFRRLQRDAEKGEAWALEALAKLYSTGANFGAVFVPKDEQKSRELIDRAGQAKHKSRRGRLSDFREAASEEANDILEPISAFLVGVFGLLPLAIIAWQVYRYLKDGYWTGISLVDGLGWMGLQWAIYPESWFGLHELLSKIGLSIASMGMLFIFAAFLDRISGKKP